MERIPRQGITDHLRVDPRVSLDGLAPLLEDQDARSFAHHEAVPSGVERAAGLFGRVVSCGEGAHGTEPPDGQRCNHRLRAAADHRIGVTPLDDFVGVTDAVTARSASGARRHVGSFGAEADGDMS